MKQLADLKRQVLEQLASELEHEVGSDHEPEAEEVGMTDDTEAAVLPAAACVETKSAECVRAEALSTVHEQPMSQPWLEH